MDQTVEAFRALADPARLRIVQFLRDQPGPVCACDIVNLLDLAQPTVSHHMGILTRSGLVLADKRGRWMFYALAEPRFATLARCLRSLASPLEQV